ncbi:MAG: division/cell wall cluster transcriptional repressor MraZ [Acidimicrobiales bacterium]|jgi:MraZ protein
MLGFVGQFQHTLDAKGRLILPSKFRVEFERGGHLSPNTEGCVALWTPGEFARQMEERLHQSRVGGAALRQQVRYWSANSSDVDFDKQGRFALPGAIREYGKLVGDVLIVGAIDHVELWNPEVYIENVNVAEEIFKQGSD